MYKAKVFLIHLGEMIIVENQTIYANLRVVFPCPCYVKITKHKVVVHYLGFRLDTVSAVNVHDFSHLSRHVQCILFALNTRERLLSYILVQLRLRKALGKTLFYNFSSI